MGHASGAYAASLKKSARRARRPDDADMPAIPAEVNREIHHILRTSRSEPYEQNQCSRMFEIEKSAS
jgi:hypothetical protein